jgi:hypothetical protein
VIFTHDDDINDLTTKKPCLIVETRLISIIDIDRNENGRGDQRLASQM